MSDEGKEGTKPVNVPSGEAELWSYLSKGDGIHCPIYDSCRLRLKGGWCINDHEEHYQLMNEFLDDENRDLSDPSSVEFKFSYCPQTGSIFKLVRELAQNYRENVGIDCVPVPTDLITHGTDGLPIEVRKLSLNALHGAVWRLDKSWLVHINSNDTSARQRFTLYHEIFHILAHCEATPIFKRISCRNAGSFNEMLADHFSAVILMPYNWLKRYWIEGKDINQIAAIFDVPRPILWFGLKHLKLI